MDGLLQGWLEGKVEVTVFTRRGGVDTDVLNLREGGR